MSIRVDTVSVLGGFYDELMASSTARTTSARRRGTPSKGDQREEQILTATRSLLTHRPMADVTIDEIASAAGISRTSFYFYFPSKQAVLATLMEQTWDQFSTTHEWFDSDGPHPDLLRAQLDAIADIWRANGPILACVGQSPQGSGYPPLEDFIGRARQRFIERLATKIDRDRALGLAPDGPPATELATLVYIVRDGRLADLTATTTTSETAYIATRNALAEAIIRMIYGILD